MSRVVPEVEFALRGEFIALDALLKATGLVSSGGEAKQLIGAGLVTIDQRPESARSRKVRAGQVVRLGESVIRIAAAPDPGSR